MLRFGIPQKIDELDSGQIKNGSADAHCKHETRESVMPVESILFLGLVISALAVFAATLTYAEWATRQAASNTLPSAQIKREVSLQREEPASICKAA